jgi:hypothetical protein
MTSENTMRTMGDDSPQIETPDFGYDYTRWTEWFGDLVGSPQWVYFPSLQRNIERERGFLSKADRRLLLETHELDLSDKTQRNARTRVRNRVLSAYFDAQFLQFISDRDRELIMDNARKNSDGLDFSEGFKQFVRFSYLGLLERDQDINITRILEEAVEEAEEEYALDKGDNVSVQVEVEIKRGKGADIEALEQRYSTKKKLTDQELDVLVNSEHTDAEPTIDAAEIGIVDAIYYAARQPGSGPSSTITRSRDREEAEEIVAWLRDFFDEYGVETRGDLEDALARLKEFDQERCDELLANLDELIRVAPHFEEQLAEQSYLSEQDAKLLDDIIWNPDNLDVEAALKKEVRPRLAGDEWEPAEDDHLQKFIGRISVARDLGMPFVRGGESGTERWEQVQSIAEFDEEEWSDYMNEHRLELCRSELRDTFDRQEVDASLIDKVDSWEEFLEHTAESDQLFPQFEYTYSEDVLDAALEGLMNHES